MSLTSAMFAGFSGIKSNAVTVDTVGNNLANLNTVAFKGQRTIFETLLYRTIDEGEGPSGTTGGTSPRQVGSGSGVAAIQRDHRQGSVDATGIRSDLAIDGEGFFVVQMATGEQAFTRDGAFQLNSTQTLVSTNGLPVQVFAADASGNIDTGSLGSLVIPLGTANAAVATTNVIMDGQLDSASSIASAGGVTMSQPLLIDAGAPATASSALTSLVDENGLPLFAAGDILSVTGQKGGVAVSEASFTIGDTGSTLGDLATFMETALGINTDPATGGTPGISIGDGVTGSAGALIIQSNFGEINAITLDGGSIVNTTGLVSSPFAFEQTAEAVGPGTTTSFGVFDSQGNLVDVRIRLALESKSATGTSWRYYAESEGDTDLSPVLGSGTISFDTNGQFVAATGTGLSIDRDGVGATTPLPFTLDFSGLTSLASTSGRSVIIMASQDGAPPGVLTNYAIDLDGMVTATFSNQQTEVLGQIALATFANNEGLLGLSNNLFINGPNSGDAAIVAPRTGIAGATVAGALEQSNVEIAREFVNLISASTGISSASRVVRVADELLQELLLLAR